MPSASWNNLSDNENKEKAAAEWSYLLYPLLEIMGERKSHIEKVNIRTINVQIGLTTE